MARACEQCGNEFEPKRNAKFCSTSCYNKDWDRRNRKRRSELVMKSQKKHPDRMRERRKRFRENHADDLRDWHYCNYWSNPQHHRQRVRQWQINNPVRYQEFRRATAERAKAKKERIAYYFANQAAIEARNRVAYERMTPEERQAYDDRQEAELAKRDRRLHLRHLRKLLSHAESGASVDIRAVHGDTWAHLGLK